MPEQRGYSSNQRKRAVICATEEEARSLATGQYRAYRVYDATGRECFVVAINPVLARGVGAEAFGIVSEMLDKPARVTQQTLLTFIAKSSDEERAEILAALADCNNSAAKSKPKR